MLRFIRRNLRWFVVGAFYAAAFRAVYLDLADQIPVSVIAAMCACGAICGIFLIMLVDRLLAYCGSKINNWAYKK